MTRMGRTWIAGLAVLAVLAGALQGSGSPAVGQRVDDRRAEDQYNFATELFGKKFYELAVQQYEKFVADHPAHPNVERAWIRIGESYLRLKKNDQALAAYTKVLAEKPESKFRLEILLGIGLANYNLNQFGKAAEALAEAQKLAIQANDAKLGPIASNWLGESLYQDRKYAEAIPAYQAVLRWPQDALAPQALYSIGFCQQSMGQEDQALVTWLQVVERYKEAEIAPEALYRAGEALLRKKAYPIAEKTFSRLLTEYKQSAFAPRAQLGLGWVAFHQQDYRTARAAFEAVATLYPQSEHAGQARLRAADCAYYMKDYAAAAKAYEAIARAGAHEVGGGEEAREAKYWLAVCRLNLDQKKPAMQILADLAGDTKDRKSALRARLRLADLQLEEGENEAAAESFRAAVQIADPAVAETVDRANYGLAIALYRQKKVTDAEARFAAILQRPQKTATAPLAAIGLAQCRADQNKHAEAVAGLQEALKLQLAPAQRAAALYLMGRSQIALNQVEPAIGSLQEVVEKHANSEQAGPAASALALLLRRTNRDGDAERIQSALVKAAATNPKASEGLLRIADERRDAGDLPSAINLYQKVLQAAPKGETAAGAHGGLAICHAAEKNPDMGRIDAALKAMAQNSSEQGFQAQVRYLVGWSLERGGHLGEALEQFRAALALNPETEVAAELTLRCGTVLASQQKYAEAVETFRRVVDKYPGAKVMPNALYELAWAYVDGGQQEKATPVLERLAQGFPEHEFGVDAAFRLGELDFKEQRFAQAAARYQTVVKSKHAGKLADKALYKLGWCQRELKDMRNSGISFATLVSRHPNSDLAAESRLREAEALIEVGELNGARTKLQSLVSDRPANDEERKLDAQARVALAGIYHQQGAEKEAIETATPAATSAFGHAGARAQLLIGEAKYAAALKGARLWEAALKEFIKVTSMRERSAETDAQANFRIAECCDRVGQKKQAEQYWEWVAKTYPSSPWATRARERLGK